jgi:uncharacterized protein YbaR (Trm112 family)
MTPNLLNYLCEPITKEPLQLVDAVTIADGIIQSGTLVTPLGKSYPIINGISQFVDYVPTASVESFGDECSFSTLPISRSTGLDTRRPIPLAAPTRLRAN